MSIYGPLCGSHQRRFHIAGSGVVVAVFINANIHIVVSMVLWAHTSSFCLKARDRGPAIRLPKWIEGRQKCTDHAALAVISLTGHTATIRALSMQLVTCASHHEDPK